MKTAIIIPARYGSTRFPGKPLVSIAGQSMLSHVVGVAREASKSFDDITLAVATEDERIAKHCEEIGVACVMTSADCPTGSDRVLEAAEKLGQPFEFILGLQGDAPFTPVEAPRRMLETMIEHPHSEVVTPIVRLRWEELDNLRESKEKTPFSGTTCVTDANGRALWFSKNIIPAIRGEEKMRQSGDGYSPVYQHIGLYGFKYDILKRFVSLPQGTYEQLEGLEQLRLIENGLWVQAVTIDVDLGMAQAGIDSPEDVVRAEKVFAARQSAA